MKASPLAALILLARDALDRQRAELRRARGEAESASKAEAALRDRIAGFDREVHASRRGGERLDVQTMRRTAAYRALLTSDLARSRQAHQEAVEGVNREEAQVQEKALRSRILET